MKTIGNKIKELRRSKGMSQKEIRSYQSGGKQMGE